MGGHLQGDFTMKYTKWAAVSAACVLLPTTGFSDVNYYVGSFLTDYQQFDDNPPAMPDYSFFGASISADTNGDLISGLVTNPLATTVSVFSINMDNNYLLGYSGLMADEFALEAAFPSGSYDYSILGGNLAGNSAALNVPAYDFPTQVPYLDGASWSALQHCPSGVDQSVTFPAFSTNYAPTYLSTNVYLFDYTWNTSTLIDSQPGGTLTSALFPGSLMLSGHAYAYELDYNNVYETNNAGFGAALASCGFARRTVGYFRVAADPGTISGKFYLADHYYNTGRTVQVQVFDDQNQLEYTTSFQIGAYNWYAVDIPSSGVKTIIFKGDTWLGKAVAGVDLSVGQDDLDVTLANGDCDGNNVVDLGDFDIVAGAFGTTSGDAGYDPLADLNGDFNVDLGDFDILAAAFGMEGDGSW